jgi:mutator protein MutT
MFHGSGYRGRGAGSLEPVVVVAAVIERDGEFLLTLRPDGSHLAGHWEFPGGKCHSHETHTEALRRELFEELDIVGRVGECLFEVTHTYAEHTVVLHFYRCAFEGTPKPMLGQQMRWVPRDQLRGLRFPDADAALIERLAG